jgi:hypothetical protein
MPILGLSIAAYNYVTVEWSKVKVNGQIFNSYNYIAYYIIMYLQYTNDLSVHPILNQCSKVTLKRKIRFKN